LLAAFVSFAFFFMRCGVTLVGDQYEVLVSVVHSMQKFTLYVQVFLYKITDVLLLNRIEETLLPLEWIKQAVNCLLTASRAHGLLHPHNSPLRPVSQYGSGQSCGFETIYFVSGSDLPVHAASRFYFQGRFGSGFSDLVTDPFQIRL